MCGAVAITETELTDCRHVPNYEIQSDDMYFGKTFQRSKAKNNFKSSNESYEERVDEELERVRRVHIHVIIYMLPF